MSRIAPEFWVRGWAQVGGLVFYSSYSGELVLKPEAHQPSVAWNSELQSLGFCASARVHGQTLKWLPAWQRKEAQADICISEERKVIGPLSFILP
jgi:hypothetical protein